MHRRSAWGSCNSPSIFMRDITSQSQSQSWQSTVNTVNGAYNYSVAAVAWITYRQSYLVHNPITEWKEVKYMCNLAVILSYLRLKIALPEVEHEFFEWPSGIINQMSSMQCESQSLAGSNFPQKIGILPAPIWHWSQAGCTTVGKNYQIYKAGAQVCTSSPKTNLSPKYK